MSPTIFVFDAYFPSATRPGFCTQRPYGTPLHYFDNYLHRLALTVSGIFEGLILFLFYSDSVNAGSLFESVYPSPLRKRHNTLD